MWQNLRAAALQTERWGLVLNATLELLNLQEKDIDVPIVALLVSHASFVSLEHAAVSLSSLLVRRNCRMSLFQTPFSPLLLLVGPDMVAPSRAELVAFPPVFSSSSLARTQRSNPQAAAA
eukprot:2455131-Rhodomonas_salina.1